MGSCAAPSAKGDDKFITTDYLQQCPRGWLDDDDMIILLEGQRDLARLRANNAQIALGSRIRSTVIRLIDIALALLVGAL